VEKKSFGYKQREDSMVMLHLFQQLDYEMGIAHCNFQLREMESFEDQI
jgi:tRNA(Ile)-lysidine synthase